ncbi:hypothetical protein PMAYCL1PPCAC_25462, partial [Pristionchus mayeri]
GVPADSDIEVLEQPPAAAVAQLTYPVRAMTDVTSLAKAIASATDASVDYLRSIMAAFSKGNIKRRRRARAEVITLSDNDESLGEVPPARTGKVSSVTKELEVVELDDEPEEPADPSAIEEMPIAPVVGDQSDDDVMVIDQSADVPA